MKNEIREATRRYLALSEGKKHYGKMAVYQEATLDLAKLLTKIQKKGLTPGSFWVFKAIEVIAKRYEKKALQAEHRGTRTFGRATHGA